MAKHASWSDLFKFSTDVLEEDYIYDKNFQIKTKTKVGDDETNLKIEQSKPDDQGSTNSAEFKYKHSCKDCGFEAKVKSGGKASTELEYHLSGLNEQFKGWSYILSATMTAGSGLDKGVFTSSLKHKTDNIEAKITADHAKKGEITVESTLKATEDGSLVLGGTSTLNLTDRKIEKYSLGFARKFCDQLSVGGEVKVNDGVNLGNIKFYTLRNVGDNLKLAINLDYAWQAKNLEMAFGFHKSCSSGKHLKGKITTGGLIALSAKYEIGSGLNLLWSTGVDLATKAHLHSNPYPFGIGIDYKF